jgi:spore maturation protein SpmA
VIRIYDLAFNLCFKLTGLLRLWAGAMKENRENATLSKQQLLLLFRSESFSALFILRLIHDC